MNSRRTVAALCAITVSILVGATPAIASTQAGDEYIRTQCRDVSFTEGPGRVRFCDKQYATTSGQRRHVVTATQLSTMTMWTMRVSTRNKSTASTRPIGTTSWTLTITDSWSSSLTVLSQIYVKSDWDMPYAVTTFTM